MRRVEWLRWAFWPVLLLFIAACGLKFGATTESWVDVWASLGDEPEGNAGIIATYRLPRVAAGAVVGIHFALAGLIMQIVLRNPLADPTLFGISGGAALAVVSSMFAAVAMSSSSYAVSVTTDYIPLAALPYIALIGALLATALVFWLSYDNGFSVLRMTLIGVITGAVLNAFVMALILSLAESQTELAILWLAGSLYARDFSHIVPTLPWTLVGLFIVVAYLRQLSILRFDNFSAQSLGVNIGVAQPLLIIVAAALAASAVSIAGPVGFVGLLVPYISRIVGYHSLSYQVWISVFIGAGLVIASDALGRALMPPIEIPVGIVSSLIGAPVFALILNRRKGKM